ncbi:MAG: alpha-glycosidase [Clostridia bacterium]|nr:alpha-glycosidase [Clostridia bacterium]
MNEKAMIHTPESKYCFALDENRVKLRLRISAGDIPDRICAVYGGKYDFAVERKSVAMKREREDALYAYYTVTLNLDDKRLVYVFEIEENGKISYFSEDGLTDTYDFELSYYNCFQYAYVNGCDVLRPVEWVKTARFYQIFVDRFNIGDNNKDKSYINLKWGEKPDPKSFAGGDIKGITEKLGYIKGLGLNVLYLTPVFSSVSNHKYDINDYYSVDKAFGDKADLKELVRSAHEKGMKVVLDAVFNHCSENLKEFQDVLKNGRKSKFYDWFAIKGDSPLEYECFAACRYMPKFNTANPEVREYLLGIATYWIKELDIDGWRLDVSDEVSHEFWRDMRRAVKKLKPDCVLIGENWHDANSYLQGDQFDSIMNYAFTKACLDYYAFGKFDAKNFADKLNEILMRNTDTVNDMMLNLLDSHDTHRFLTRVGGNVNSLLSALCVAFFFSGAPCVYYGTENAMEGGYDPDCRRTFDWTEEGRDNPVKTLIRRLSELREKHFADAEVKIYADGGKLVMERGKYKLTAQKDKFEIE